MLSVESSAVIDRPVDEVFTFTVDVDNVPLWVPGALEARRVSDGPTTVGTEFVQVTHFLGRRFESQFEVTEFEANHRFSFKSTSGPFPIETFVTFEPTGSATRVTQILRGEPGGFFNVARAVLVRLGQRQLDSGLGNLKDLLEGKPKAAG